MADKDLKKLQNHLKKHLKDSLFLTEISHGELSISVRKDALKTTVKQFRDDPSCDFNILLDITAVDHPERDQRFDVVYHFLSLKNNQRIRLKVMTDEATPVDSIVDLYSTAGWFEREVWDMYGIYFNDNPDLRRILTDYGFEGHPLRKDFPLTGYVELRYDQEQKRVVYEPVKLTQDFRTFDYLSPWEGLTDMQLPGDEKAMKPPYNPLDDEEEEVSQYG